MPGEVSGGRSWNGEGGMCYWPLVGRGRDAAKHLIMSFANLGVLHTPVRVLFLPQMPMLDACFHGAAVEVMYQGVKSAPTNCFPPGKGLLGTIVQQEPEAGVWALRVPQGWGLPMKRQYARAICARGAAFQKPLLELCSSFHFFFGKVHWPLLIPQISLCSDSLKIKDIKNQERRRHLTNLNKCQILLVYTLWIYKNARCPV